MRGITLGVVSQKRAYYTLFSEDEITATLFDEEVGVHLGMKFTVSMDGWIYGTRFYKSLGHLGINTAQLFDIGGNLLASEIYENESVSGWQSVYFTDPQFVSTGGIYIISYHNNMGYYSSTNNFFTEEVVNGPITALNSDDVRSLGNGVFKYSPTPSFPDETWAQTNYWIDILFST